MPHWKGDLWESEAGINSSWRRREDGNDMREHSIKERSGRRKNLYLLVINASPGSYARNSVFMACSWTIIDGGMEYWGRYAQRYSIHRAWAMWYLNISAKEGKLPVNYVCPTKRGRGSLHKGYGIWSNRWTPISFSNYERCCGQPYLLNIRLKA